MSAVAAKETDQGLRIVSLEASAFKRLRAVRIDPGTGAVVRITGRNGQGKSSVLDAIMAALGGTRNAPDRPVRRGNKKAEIRLDIGDLIIERRFTESGSSLVVRGRDGAELRSPQAVLDQLLGDLAFDPLAFTRLEPRQQVAVLQRVANLEGPMAALDRARQEKQAAKTEAARTVKLLDVQLSALPDIEGPDEEVSAADLADALTKAATAKANNDKARRWLAEQRAACAKEMAEIDRLRAELVRAETRHADLRKLITAEEPGINAMVDPDIGAIQTQIREVETLNVTARKRIARRETLAKLRTATDADRAAGRELEQATFERETLLASAKLPVPGLTFTEDGVLLNGIPFDQASSAEQIRASVAMGLAQNPRLRVMLVREGSLLDSKSLQLLAAVAEEHDAQIWIEQVTDGEQVGILIEDGEVVANTGGAQ